MKNPAAFSQRMSMSDEFGQCSGKSQSLLVLAISFNCALKNSLISLSTEEYLTLRNLNTLVIGQSDLRQNLEWM